MKTVYILHLFLSLFLFPFTLSAGDGGASLPTNAPGSPSQDYLSISEEKRELILRLRTALCLIVQKNDFHLIKTILKNAGRHYVGDAITIEEAYPHIDCDETAANLDLFRMAVGDLSLNIFFVDFLRHFTTKTSDKSFWRKMVSCKKDFGQGCLDAFEYIEHMEMWWGRNAATVTRRYDFLKMSLSKALRRLGGPIRDPKFCREVLDEPLHCQ